MFLIVLKFLLHCCVKKDFVSELLESAFISVKVSDTITIKLCMYVYRHRHTIYYSQDTYLVTVGVPLF
jgi:hypothetical protein